MNPIDPARADEIMERAVCWLQALADQFKPGTCVTILARVPGADGGEMLVTTDTLDGIRAALDTIEARGLSDHPGARRH